MTHVLPGSFKAPFNPGASLMRLLQKTEDKRDFKRFQEISRDFKGQGVLM